MLKGEQRTPPVTKQTASPSQVMVKRALSREGMFQAPAMRKTGLSGAPKQAKTAYIQAGVFSRADMAVAKRSKRYMLSVGPGLASG